MSHPASVSLDYLVAVPFPAADLTENTQRYYGMLFFPSCRWTLLIKECATIVVEFMALIWDVVHYA
jgi:hypothetical protein